MSDSGGVTLDSVIINIETRAGESLDNIDKLATALGNLKSAIKGGFHSINTLAEYIKTLNTASKKIPTINENLKPMGQITRKLHLLENIESPLGVKHAAQYLENLAVASQKVASTGQNLYAVDKLVYPLKELSTIQSATGLGYTVKRLEDMAKVAPNIGVIVAQASRLPKLVEPLQALKNIETPRGFGYITKNLTTLEETLSKITPDTLDKLSKVSNELTKTLTPLAEKMNQIAQGYAALDKLASKYGITVGNTSRKTRQATKDYSSLRHTTNALTRAVKNLTNTTVNLSDKATKGFDKLFSKLKQVGLSLLGTRTLFTAVRKAVSEYMQLDEQLQKQTTNLWRALGAQLAPAIEYVLYLFKQFTRVVYSIIYALTGIDLIARANAKALQSMSNSAASALGNLQKFDDLNVVEFDKGKDDNLIDLDKIDLTPIQKVIDWMKKLKKAIQDAWNSGQWYGVGQVLAEGINGALNAVDFTKIKNALKIVAEDFGDTLQGFFDNFDATKFGEQLTNVLKLKWDALAMFLNEMPWSAIGDRLSEAIATFEPGELIKSFGEVIKALAKGLTEVISKQDAATIARKLIDALKVALEVIGEILLALPWKELGTGIRDMLKEVKWEDVVSVIEKALANILQPLNKFFAGLFGVDEEKMSVWLLPLLVGIGLLIGLVPKLISSIGKAKGSIFGIGDAFNKLSNLATIIVLIGGFVIVIREITSLLKVFRDTGMTVTDAVGLLVTVFLGISVAVMAMAAAFGLMDWTAIAAGAVILAGLSVVIMSLTTLILALKNSGIEISSVIDLLLVGFVAIAGLMGMIVLLGPAMTAGLVPFSILMGEIALLLIVMAATIPTILDACGKFVDKIAPPIIKILEILSELIVDIIYALGDVLPPIIREVGSIFNTVFNGIAKVITTVGDTIVRILNAVGDLVDSVLKSILNFIRELGPAINIFVDNTIKAITKLVNFIVSAVEFFINGIVSGINGLSSGLRKVGNKIFEIIGVDVTFNPISKVKLDRFAPKLETGTNEIPYEGLYHLHQGEAVVPKKYNPALGNGTDEELGQKLDTLISVMNNMNFTNVVNIGNKTIYKEQQRYTKKQNDIYGTTVNL